MASKTSVLINIAYALASAAYCIMHDVDRRLQAEEGRISVRISVASSAS